MVNTVIDLAIRIKNGYLAKKAKVNLKYSKFAEQVIRIFKREKYIKDYKVISDNDKKSIEASLLYQDGEPSLTEIKIISKPGRRMYSKAKDLKPTLGGLGITILSTPKGVMTGKEAKKNKAGGEVLFEIW